MATYDWISFTTDYGTRDGFDAVCRGVIASISPRTRVLDVTHQIPPQDVRRGAMVLAQTVPWLPRAVHLAVVDPGVGSDRRGITVETPRGLLVGPDNGLLLPAAEALGGVTAAYELGDRRHHLAEASATFHGRDVFAPVAARLCRGLDPAALGPPVDPADLVRLDEPTVTVTPGRLAAEVLTVDAFGNVQLAAAAADLAAAGLAPGTAVTVRTGAGDHPAVVGRTFADVAPGELLVHPDSAGRVALAVNGGSAAAALGTRDRDTVRVEDAP